MWLYPGVTVLVALLFCALILNVRTWLLRGNYSLAGDHLSSAATARILSGLARVILVLGLLLAVTRLWLARGSGDPVPLEVDFVLLQITKGLQTRRWDAQRWSPFEPWS
jgi:hypothetical protein